MAEARGLTPSRMAEPVLSVRDLKVGFPTRRGTLTAVDGVSFDIAAGEVLGVVGESGAGKSLTGAAVIGLIEPPGRILGGEVRLGGARIDTLAAEAMRKVRGRRIGMVFQDPLTSLNPLYRIGDQIVETIRTHAACRQAAARERAIALLQEAGIQGARARLDSYPHEFSGGMRQRVVLALALCAEPELLIADEPTTALDVSIQAQIIALLKRLCRERGTAVMLITHDMGVIAETADRVAVMYAGRIVEIGPVREVVHNPHHPYTRGLMGAIRRSRRARRGWRRFRARCRGSARSRRAAPSTPAARRPSSAAPRAARAHGRRGVLRGRLLALCRAGSRAGRGRRMTAPPLVEVRDLSRVFDVSKPWLERVIEGEQRKLPDGGERRVLHHRPRRDAGAGGQIGLRQVDGRAHDGGAASSRPPGSVTIDGIDMWAPARAARAPAAAPAPADDLPGPVRQPQPALARRPHHRRPDPRLRPGQRQARDRAPRRRSCCASSASIRPTAQSTRTSSPAASASASASRARCRPIPSSWSATSRPARSTCRCRRRS